MSCPSSWSCVLSILDQMKQEREGGRTGWDVENHGVGMGMETAPAGKRLREAAAASGGSGGRAVLVEDAYHLFDKMPQRGNLTN